MISPIAQEVHVILIPLVISAVKVIVLRIENPVSNSRVKEKRLGIHAEVSLLSVNVSKDFEDS